MNNKRILQNFIVENAVQLQYLWLPTDMHWMNNNNKTKGLFNIIEKENLNVIIDLPCNFIERILEKESKVIDSYKDISFEPKPELKKILNECFGWYRWSYNQCVTIINQWINDNNNELLSFDKLYIEVMNIKINDNYHYDIMKDAIVKAYSNYKNSSLTLLEYYKKKRVNEEIINLVHNINYGSDIFTPIIENISSCIFPHDYLNSENDMVTITKTKDQKYSIRIINLKSYINFPLTDNINVVSIDPGVKTPFTCFDPSGKVFKISTGKSNILYELVDERNKFVLRRNNLINLSPEERKAYGKCSKKIRKMSIRILNKERKINNSRKEFHYQVIKYLIERYTIILIPELNIIDDEKNICIWGHFSFRKRLIKKARESNCCSVIIVDESFTTKTCGKCGTLNEVCSKSIFICSKCKIKLDRDVNASRNIFIKYLSELYS
jgi:transposase